MSTYIYKRLIILPFYLQFNFNAINCHTLAIMYIGSTVTITIIRLKMEYLMFIARLSPPSILAYPG